MKLEHDTFALICISSYSVPTSLNLCESFLLPMKFLQYILEQCYFYLLLVHARFHHIRQPSIKAPHNSVLSP